MIRIIISIFSYQQWIKRPNSILQFYVSRSQKQPGSLKHLATLPNAFGFRFLEDLYFAQ